MDRQIIVKNGFRFVEIFENNSILKLSSNRFSPNPEKTDTIYLDDETLILVKSAIEIYFGKDADR